MTIRVVLADDHRMFREALRLPLAAEPDIEIVAEANTGKEALAAVEEVVPDVLVLDIGLPDMNGTEVAGWVAKRFPAVKIVALSGYMDRLFVEQMFKAGAQGYVVKSSGAAELLGAVRAVARGQSYLSPEAAHAMVKPLSAGSKSDMPPLSVLGRREQEVLRLLAAGKRSLEIAEQLGITPATVDVHRRNIKLKLGLHSTAELTRYAIREGLNTA